MFAPFGLPSESRTAEWHPEPTSRGTFSLISTCLITMGLCVWTAVHLNIPEYGKTMPQLRRKALCVVLGLFAPELIAWSAYEQSRTARNIDQAMWEILRQTRKLSAWRRLLQWISSQNCLKKSRPKEPDIDLETSVAQPGVGRHPWTPIHGQYAAMGGFAIAPSHSARHTFPDLPPRTVLTRDQIVKLACTHLDLFPDVSETEIRDKSKASALAKTLVCIQAGWFCIQCFARLSQGLTISLLELNTFAHALCAFLVYTLWWDKPLDVEEPTLMQGELIDALQIAHLAACLLGNGGKGEQVLIPLLYDQVKPRVSKPITEEKICAHFTDKGDNLTSADLDTRQIEPNQLVYGWNFDYVILRDNDYSSRDHEPLLATITLHPQDVEKLRLLRLATNHFSDFMFGSFPNLVFDQNRIRNTPDSGGLTRGFKLEQTPVRVIIGVTVAGLLYGGIHLIAWNVPLPTRTQLLLWRMSGLVLVSSGAGLFLLNALFLVWGWTAENIDMNIESDFDPQTSCWVWPVIVSVLILYYILLVSSFGLYILARVYLVVECFLTLAHLPPSVFEVPTWSQYVPHIT